MQIGKLSVNNPVLVNILMVVILALGAVGLARLPQEQFSEVPFFFVSITVPYPGVSAEDVERTVTAKIENEMNGLEMLDEISSDSLDGLSAVQIEFEDGISESEFSRLFQDVQTRFSNLELPDGVGQAIIDDFSSNDFLPVIQVALSGDINYASLHRTALDISDRLERINQVSGITVVGLREREIIVEALPERLEPLGLSLNEVAARIRTRNATVPGGTLNSGGREYLLRTVEQIDNFPDLNDIILRSGADGEVRLGDVASVREEYDLEGIRARYDGKQAIVLQVTKIPGGNSVRIIEDVRARIASSAALIQPGIEVDYFGDSAVLIRDSIQVLGRNALFGAALVLLILYLFLGLRNALITALGIPITFGITFIVLGLIGDTLNGNTLFALVLSLGIIVDHAIVIVENSYRRQSLGLPKREAAIRGVDEVILPVFAATATTVAAFLPLTFLPGLLGRFLRIVPITVSIALVASTLEAAYFVPAHFAEWPGGKLLKKTEGPFAKFRELFGRLVSLLYRRRKRTLLIMGAVMVASFMLVGLIGQNLFESDEFTYFYIDIETPTGTALEKTEEVVLEFERRLVPLIGNGEVTGINTLVGFQSGNFGNVRRPNAAQIVVDLSERSEGRERSISEIVNEARRLCADIAGPEQVMYRVEDSGPPTDAPIVYRLFGDNYDDLIAVSNAIKQELGQFPQLFNIRDNLEGGNPELRIRVDTDQAARYGLDPQTIGGFIRGSFSGIDAGFIFSDNEETDIVVRYARPAISDPYQLQQLKIGGLLGEQIPFSSVARIEQGESFNRIRRLDGRREVTIEADSNDTENLNRINTAIESFYNQNLGRQYPSVELSVGGQFAEFLNLLSNILIILSVGIFLIYMILGAQFKSYTQPLTILLAIPFAFVGVILFLFVSGTPFSLIVIYAAVALAGIAVNDSIVLVSFINDLRAEGLPVGEAVINAAKTRLRPIILTSLTTIAGLAPTSLGLGGRSTVWGPMASTIIFGLLFSSTMTLLVVPCIYGLFYDRKRKRMRAESIETVEV